MDELKKIKQLKKAEQRGEEYRPPVALDGLWLAIGAGTLVFLCLAGFLLLPLATAGGHVDVAAGLQWDTRPVPQLIDVVLFAFIVALGIAGLVGLAVSVHKGASAACIGAALFLFLIWEVVS